MSNPKCTQVRGKQSGMPSLVLVLACMCPWPGQRKSRQRVWVGTFNLAVILRRANPMSYNMSLAGSGFQDLIPACGREKVPPFVRVQ